MLALAAALLFVAAAAVTVLPTRGGNDGAETPSPAAPSVLPLLGTRGQVPPRAALGVKIDDTERGRPQSGLVQADVVFEEMVEGGLTRLLAVFQSQDPDTVGPVRSARSTDLFILAELGQPLFAWSGANPTFAAAVEAADLLDVGVGAAPDAYRREPDRPAPYNLYAAPELLRAAVAGDSAASVPPPPLFSYRDEGAPLSGAGVEPVAEFRTTGSGGLSTGIAWDWDAASSSWLRSQDGTPHVDRDGEQCTGRERDRAVHPLPGQRCARLGRGGRARGGRRRGGRRVVAERRAPPARAMDEALGRRCPPPTSTATAPRSG